MAGRVQWEAQVNSNVAKLLSETKELRDQLDGIKKGNYEVKLDIDGKKLEKVISNLDKMLESLGKGTADFKEFENLSKQLNEAVSEVKELNKAFGGINSSGVSNLLSSIQSIDKSLSSLSEHITNVNKDFGSVGKNASNNVSQINEAKKATEGLAEATKELANAQKNVGNKSNISSGMKDVFQGDVKASADSSALAIKEESKAMEQVAESAEKASKEKDKFAESNKRVKQSADSSVDAVKDEKISLASIETEINNLNKKSAGFKIKPDDQHSFTSWTNQIKELDSKIAEYQSRLDAIKAKGGIVDKDDEAEISKIKKEIQNLVRVMSKTSAGERGWTDIRATKTAERLNDILEKSPKLSKEAKSQIRAYYNELTSGNPSKPLNEIYNECLRIIQKEREAGRAGKSFLDTIKDKAWYGWAAQIGQMVGFYDIINIGRQAVDTIIELDTALIDLKKTTAMSDSEMENFYFDSNDVAKEMGVTTSSIIDQASAWSRLGYNTKEASTEMAKLSSKFATISPGMETEQAQEGLVSIMKAWDIDVDKVESEVIDKINILGNSFAEENQDIVEGMKRSAAALASTGTTYQDAFALFTGAQEVLQNSEVTGRALRSISMRIHGYSENSEDGLPELDKELTNITGELINLTKTAEHTQGVSIFKDGSTTDFKSLVEYFGEINAIWDEMSQKQQNDFLQKAFGKTQAQAGSAIIQNYESVVGALEKMEQSAGSADAEMAAVESSISYKLNALKETWVGTVQEMIDRGDVGTIIDGFTKLSEAIGWAIDKLDLFGAGGLGAVSGLLMNKAGIGERTMFQW